MSTDEQPALFGGDDLPKDDRKERGQEPDDDLGFVCKRCGSRWFEVYYTRRTSFGVIRRRKCVRCGQSIMTTERLTSNGPSSTNGTI